MNRNYQAYFVLVLLWLSSSSLLAQKHILSGILHGSDNQPISGANVVLSVHPDTLQGLGTITDDKGEFEIMADPGKYFLRLSFVGYKFINTPVEMGDSDKNLGILLLKKDMKMLDEVEITGKSAPTVQIGDTTQYNAESFKINTDANAENLLEKMPGVVVQNGKVQAQGEDVKQVLVDGKRFFGDDPNAALKNIPAEIIDKIQIFDQQSEQAQFTGFDDGESKKTINIVTKLEYRNGTFGKVQGGYGTDDRYKIDGNINIFNGDRRISILGQSNNVNQQNFSTEDLVGVMSSTTSGGRSGRGGGRGGGGGGGGRGGSGGSSSSSVNDFLVNQQGGITTTNAAGFNYTDKWGEKIDVAGNYFFNKSDNSNDNVLTRKYVLAEGSGQDYDESEIAESMNLNHRFNFRFDYKINDNNSILIRPKFTYQKNDGSSILKGLTSQDSSLLNLMANNFSSNLLGYNFSNTILYRHKFAKTGRTISFNLGQDFKNNSGESFQNSETFYYDQAEFDTLDQNSDLDVYERRLSGNMRYTESLGRNKLLLINYKTSYSDNNSDKITNNFDEQTGNYSVMDTLLTNQFESRYITNEGGVGFRYSQRKINFMISAAYQVAQLKNEQFFPELGHINQTYYSILPRAMFMYRISRSKNLRIFYRSNSTAPSVSQLQNVLDNSNPIQLTIGNPTLSQQNQHTFFTRYSVSNSALGSTFFALLSGSYTHNYIANRAMIAQKDSIFDNGMVWPAGTQLTQPVNLDGYYNLRTFVTYGIPVIKIKSNLNFNFTATFARIPGLINTDINYSNSPSLSFGAVLSSNISEKLDFTLSSNSKVSWAINTLNKNLDSRYFSQLSKIRVYWNFWKELVFRSELNHQFYNGLSDGYNTNYFLWNMGLGMKFLKNRQAELTLSVFDILNQNTSINRIVTESYIEDTQSQVLQQYLMLSFSYKIRNFKQIN